MKKQSYPDLIINAFQSVQAWKSLAIMEMGALILSFIGLVWLANNQTVILIPQNFAATAKGPVNLNLGEPFSPDYLSALAKGDITLLLNWTPENIDTQYGAFISRLTPAIHDAQREILLAEAKQHTNEGLTQSFYSTRTFAKGSEVTLHGILVRATGGKEIYRGPAVFAIDYANVGGGYLNVNGVRQPTEEELRTPSAPQKSN